MYRYKNNDLVTWNRKIFGICPFKDGINNKKISEIRNDRFIGLSGVKCWWYWYELQPSKKESLYKRIKYWIIFWYWYNFKDEL